ncbi:uncharacterized protein LOC124433295 [Xenia sp. Carnegie-2017]|uniref:uncharacterized protein LOC124433295 n=1 Tax=Xenia sp. Carnegie-2017 TaxID=2897299 RepID=UPI001F035DC2|nr:uncharacterized protein LOC124433295 [Xenia sp. Carnegie-2017]XP_046839117.1 uncharacterized protein LOC124433295 [Xenia sp. Carnegie-2017]XP_046839191.1 uncharacterized protein LOC124433295 [Xenia sp. Carnegie-2017]
MEDKSIQNSQITASSYKEKRFPYGARLHNKTYNRSTKSWGAWCADENDPSPYLQIDLDRKRNISMVATQGFTRGMFVKKYKLNYSTDAITWLAAHAKPDSVEFDGNKDNGTVKNQKLRQVVTARYVRFLPKDWNLYSVPSYPCMRVEIYVCLPVKGSVPRIAGKQSERTRIVDADPGAKVALRCKMYGQAGIILNWFTMNQKIKESANIKISKSANDGHHSASFLILKNVTMNENGLLYECRGQYPGVENLYETQTILLRVGVDQPPIQLQSKTHNSLSIEVKYRLANRTVQYRFEIRAVGTQDWTSYRFNQSQNDIYTIKKLKPWTEYQVKVIPEHKEANDIGRMSRTKNFTTAQGFPDKPQNLHLSDVKQDNATIQWSKPSRDEVRGVIEGYYMEVIDDTKNVIEREKLPITNVSMHTITFLLPNTSYTVHLAVQNQEKQGQFATLTFITTSLTPEKHKPTASNPFIDLNLLNQRKITHENVVSVAKNVKNLTSLPDKLNPTNISTAAEILEKIIKTQEKSMEVGDIILETINNLIDVKEKALQESNSSTRFIKILEDFIANGGDFSKNTSNIQVKIIKNLNIMDGNLKQFFPNGSSIEIPREVLEKAKNKTMYFIYYKNGNLFNGKRYVNEICSNGFTENVYEQSTAVISSGISGQELQNLSEKVVFKFHVSDPKAVAKPSSCVYWDFKASAGKGNWSNKGCKLKRIYGNTIECVCDHMTNFAVLMDVHSDTSKSCGVHGDILQLLSYLGCGLSILGLTLTIFTYSFFRRLRKELAAKILIQLCVALLCVLVVFIVGIERSRVGRFGCFIVAGLLHYFILSAFLWMLIEARFMYLAFVKVWTQHGEHELLKCSFIAWGSPAIVVGITMAVDLNSYGSGHYCLVKGIPFFASFFAPVICIIFLNLIVFGIIMQKLSSRPESSLGRDRNTMRPRMKQAIGILILVGVTWSFGALSVSSVRLFFAYLFVFFNSIQGFCIFIFYCLSQKNVRDCWKALLTCQLHKLYKDKSFHTNTFDRRRNSTLSTTQNTLSLARKKTTSSSSMAYPIHSMDTLTRNFTSFNCVSSNSLTGSKDGMKPNNLNNFKEKDCNLHNGMNNKSNIWKRVSNAVLADESEKMKFSNSNPTLTRTNSSQTLWSNDSYENDNSYDMVACSDGSLVSLHSLAESQASDNYGFYSLVDTKDSCNSSMNGDSAPGTPRTERRPEPISLAKNNHLSVPSPTKKHYISALPQECDPSSIPDDFGKLIINPSRGSVRGVRGVVETSVDTYAEDSNVPLTPQASRLAEDVNNEQQSKYGSNDCIASPMYFAQNGRTISKDRSSSGNGTVIGDVCL